MTATVVCPQQGPVGVEIFGFVLRIDWRQVETRRTLGWLRCIMSYEVGLNCSAEEFLQSRCLSYWSMDSQLEMRSATAIANKPEISWDHVTALSEFMPEG